MRSLCLLVLVLIVVPLQAQEFVVEQVASLLSVCFT